MVKISCIVPTYNEAEGILIFLQRLKKVFQNIAKSYQSEIIIVDDNSPDKTAKIIKKNYRRDRNIKIFVRKRERGLGKAIKYGIKKASGEIILGIDADGNHQPEKIPLLLKKLKTSDLVVASRFISGGGVEKRADIFRHLASFGINCFFRFLGFPVWDSTSGFYVIKKKKLEGLNIDKIYYGYGDYHLRLVYFAKLKNYRIKEIPCVYKKRIAGESKSRLFKMFFNYFIEALRLRF